MGPALAHAAVLPSAGGRAPGVLAPRAERGRGREAPPLPEEVLGAPVGAADLFVERMEEWRRALGWSHARFAAYLGISRQYWYALRTRRQGLTIGVAQRVLRERPELEHFLGSAIRERQWGHRRVGDDQETSQERS